MKVFSNTTPFIALAAIERLDLLPRLFGQLYVTPEVIEECAAGGGIIVPTLRQLDWIIETRNPGTMAPHILLELDKRINSSLAPMALL